MRTKTIAFIAALALAGLGFAAVPVLAKGGAEDSDACRAAMAEAKENRTRENQERARLACKPAPEDRCAGVENDTAAERCEAKASFRGERDGASQEFRTERDQAKDEYHHEKARLREAYDRSNESQREEAKERMKEAREHYKDAKERAREKYHDRLKDARASFAAERDEDGKCAERPECIDRKIAQLERRKDRAETVQAHLEAKLANETADDDGTDGNGTAEDFREKDHRLGLQIAILQMERHINRIDAQIAEWEAKKADLAGDDSATADDASEGEDTSDDEDAGEDDEVTDLTPDDGNETDSP